MKKFTLATCLLVLITAWLNNASGQDASRVMVTYAGTGISGFTGDWGSPRVAEVAYPHDLCMDAAQNIYFVDQSNARIRMISAMNGGLTTVAGGGTSLADGIAATSALLTPNYMCIDASGNLFITTSNQVREVNITTGIITTIAGSATAGSSGDGGPAISALLDGPQGICIDASGNLYIVDGGSNKIREITAATGIINTIAGTGTYGYSGDGGAALSATLGDAFAIGVDASGNVFFSDQGGNYIREIVAATGMMQHIAGVISGVVAAASGGMADTTAIGQIYGIHIDHIGDLYCCDGSCSCVRIERSSGRIYLEAGSLASDGYNGDDFNAINDWLNVPGGLWVDPAGNIFIADANNNRVRKVIQLTATPTFAFGKVQFINACASAPTSVDSQLTITELNVAEAETWTVISAPANGTMTGFPYTGLSLGTASVLTPGGVNYVPTAGYTGYDSFKVQVSNGTLSDVVTVYLAVGAGNVIGSSRICAGGMTLLTDGIPGGTWSKSNEDVSLLVDGTIIGDTAGMDVIAYTVNTTCGVATAASTVTVDMTAPTTAGTITGGTSVCTGTTLTLANATGAGVWSVSTPDATITTAGVLSGVTAGTETVVYTVTNSCGSIATSEVIAVNPQPDAGTITSSETNVCIGSSITLTDGAASGVWSAKNGHSTITSDGLVMGVTAGTDTLQYSVTNTCGTATASEIVMINKCTTGVTLVSSTPGVSLFPNPAAYSLNVSWEALQPGNATVVITDVTSREVLKTGMFDNNNGNGTTQLNIANLAEGVYFLTFDSESAHYTNKFVVSK